MTNRPGLILDSVVKSFGAVRALKGVSFDVQAGEVHALVGENGAGKSTLMSIAAGSLPADGGTIEIGGEQLDHPTPATARALGLAVVYQHPAVVDALTVKDNMILAVPKRLRPSISNANDWTAIRLETVGADISPDAKVSQLSAAQRQLLEIAKALAGQPLVLVLDEPTESLTSTEIERLFDRIIDIKGRGTAVVYISHRLHEVERIADRVTVLRDGATRGTFQNAEVSTDDILALIVGRSIDAAFPPKHETAEQAVPMLGVSSLTGRGFADVSLSAQRGEIVGVAGVSGNGQDAFLRALAGLNPGVGNVRIDGDEVRTDSPQAALRAGLVYIPNDRHREGLFMSRSVRENASLLNLSNYASGGIVRMSRERAGVQDQADALNVKTSTIEAGVTTLSGGNQQKVVLARSLLATPKVLLCDEPTHGVDAGARVEIYAILRRLAQAGTAVIVCSSDNLELEGLCDRVHVFSRGRVVDELSRSEVTEDNITRAALTSQASHLASGEGSSKKRRTLSLLSGDHVHNLVLVAAIAVLTIYTTSRNGSFLSTFSVQNMLLLAAALVFVSIGQLVVVLTAGVDLSVGPLIGVLVCIASFVASTGHSGAGLLVAALIILAAAIAVGLTNGLMVRGFGIPPIVATLAMYIVLQGVGLLLRPTPGGTIDTQLVSVIDTNLGFLPLVFIIAVGVAFAAEYGLRRTVLGIRLRAAGADESSAHRLGIRVPGTVVGAYVACSCLTAVGAILVSAQVGTGDPTVGVNYTLTSLTAVVLGGASIHGGRGSFIATLLGAVLVSEIVTALGFLQLDDSWQYLLPGLLILAAAAIYSRSAATSSRSAASPSGVAV